MGDRSPASVVIYHCPESYANALHKVVTAYFEQVDWDTAAPPDELLIGTPYTDFEMNLSIAGELGPQMVLAAPMAVFAITSDPYADYPGELWMYDPTIEPGVCVLPIDGDGNVVWSFAQIQTFITNQESGFGSSNLRLIAAFRKAMGGDWFERQQQLSEKKTIPLTLDLTKEN